MGINLWIGIIVGVLVIGLGGLILLGRGSAITRGRYGRLARLGRLGARLWTSSVGAKLRRLVMPKHKRERYDEARRKRDAEAVVQTMGQMKGAIMKVGQMLSFVTDSVPIEYRAALESLQASAPPMDFALLRDVAERELGMPLERAFARFDEEPLASASIGQVHRAVLPTGEQVVVKIQYPGVAEAIRADLDNAGVLYRMIGMFYPELDPKPLVAEVRARIGEELDYRQEAANQKHFAALYADHPSIVVPRVFDSHSTACVLTSEYVEGRRFAEILDLDQDARNRYGRVLWQFVFGSIIRHGAFNGDPQPGNFLFTDDGKIVFLDFGCVKYFPDRMLANWMTLVRAHMEGRVDDFRAAVVELGFIKESSPLTAELLYDYFAYFYAPITEDREFTFTKEYTGQSMEMVFKPKGRFAGIQNKLNMPPDFVFVNRIQWGVYSLLADLGASDNWRAIHSDYLYGDAEPPLRAAV
jgi:predicted unusual protein kinase regulating ubiquinone biosynthesis (AarF/ABC1/UbiB family)